MLKLKHIFLLWFFLLPFTQWSQTEPELKEAAENLFKKEQYVEATSLFLRLLSLQPKDYDYNYKYGTCLLFNSNKKQDAIRYLAYSVKGPGIAPDAFYFLAKAYHLNFQFTEAIANYKAYQNKAGSKGFYYLGAERNIDMCLNGQKLLSSITEIVVKKKTEIANAEFFRIYDLTNIGGSIVVGKDFQTKTDKKVGHIPIVHLPDGASKIFYSSYGDGNQKDIYYVERTAGAFSDPIKVSGDVNTGFDEDYPYMHPNGEYLYFSSKGHNSMGGYDVFRAKYDAGANRLGNVENVDFAISSPDDDILYMVDKDDKYAYFASARQSQNGKIYVYEVLVDRVPVQLAILKGSFESRIDASNKTMIVDVYDKTSGAKVGRFRTNEKGEYIITFPKGGKYEYRASVECSNEKFIAQVDIPFLKQFKPLKQKAVHEAIGDGEVLKVINLFDEEVEDAQSLIAEILKQKSDLDVNIINFDMNALTAANKKSPILAELGLSKMSTFEASQLLELKANEFKNSDVDGSQSGANALVVNSADEIKLIDDEIKELVAESKTAKTDDVKYSLLQQAKELAETRDAKLTEIENIEKTVTKAFGGGISKENQESFIGVSNRVKDLLNAGKEDEALEAMANNRAILKNVLNTSSSANTEDLAENERKLTAELQKLDQRVETYAREIDGIQSEIATLKLQKETASAKNKEGFQNDIDVKKEQLAELNVERASVQKTQKAKATERKTISSEMEAILALTNYNGPKVTKEQAESSKNGLRNSEAKTVKNSVDQELASLLASNPSLEGTGTLTVAQRIMAEHSNEAGKIKASAGLSEKARNEQLLALDIETKEQLQERLVDVKNELAGDRFNEGLKNELAKIENYTSSLDADIVSIQNASAVATNNNGNDKSTNTNNSNNTNGTNNANNATNSNSGANSGGTDVASITSESVRNSVDSEYQSKRNAITATSSNTPSERLTALQNLDEEYLNVSRKKLAETERSLRNDPDNPALKKQKDILSELIDQKIDEIDERDSELAQLASASADIAANNTNNNESNNNESNNNSPTNGSNNNTSNNGSNNNNASNNGTNNTNTNGSNNSSNTNTNATNLDDNTSNTSVSGVTDELKKRTIESIDEYYVIEIAALNSSKSSDRDEKVITREERLQSNIGKRISEIDDLIAAGNNGSALATELAILKAEASNSRERVKILEGGTDAASTNTNGNNSGNNTANSNENSISANGNSNSTSTNSNTNSSNTLGNVSRTNVLNGADNSYTAEIGALQRSTSTDKFDKLLDRELQFQSSLGKQISAKTDELEADESNDDLRAELKILNDELKASRIRADDFEDKAADASSTAGTNTFDSEQYIDEVRSDILSSNAPEVESTYSTKSQLQGQDDVLRAYEDELKNIIKSKKQASNVGTDLKLIGELNSIESEFAAVQKKRREISVTLGEIDQLATSSEDIADNAELKTEIDNNNSQIADLISVGNFDSNETALHSAKKAEIDKFLSFAEVAKSDEDKNKSYNIAKKAQVDLLQSMSDSKIASREAELAKSAEVDEISTKDELEKLKRRYSIEIGELTQSIITAKTPANGSPDPNKIAILEQEKSVTQSKLIKVEARLAKITETTPVIDFAAKNQTVPTDVQAQIAASSEYDEYVKAATAAMESENDLNTLNATLDEEKVALKKLIEDEVINGTDRSIEIEERKNRIRRYSISIGDLERKYETRRQLAVSKLPMDESRRLQYQNLMYRGVPANPQLASSTSGNSTNRNTSNTNSTNSNVSSTNIANNNNASNVGIDINPNRTISNPIITEYSSLKGLVYRVQIGAFSKPIPQDLFKEFTPVTGEKVGGTKITRYMAGAFNDSKKVLEVRDQIRRLGYADAFPVAYCDGKRISFGEALELQRSGGCVGSGNNNLTVTNTNSNNTTNASTTNVSGTNAPTTNNSTINNSTTNNATSSSADVSYNEALGAAKAAAIEQKLGLFFTVQIGVFNKPAEHSQLFFLEPLLTLKLKNNQIRYSCGTFKSLADAKVKLAEVKAKGITDAFVTVYYKGERLGLEEGIQLLETQGASILEP